MTVRVFDLTEWADADDPEDLTERRLRRRRRAFQHAATQSSAVDVMGGKEGAVVWSCPTCGGSGHGRPTVAGASVSTSSHGDWAVMVIDRPDTFVGIDITPVSAPAEADAIAAEFFSPTEAQQRPSGGWTEGPTFARLWSAKEALGKARGTGIAVPSPQEPGGSLDTSTPPVTARCLEGLCTLPPHLVGSLVTLSRDDL